MVTLNINEWYIIRYKVPGDRKERVMTARYMGWSRFYNKYEFDLRPLAGTQEIHPEWVKDIEAADDTTPVLPVAV
jgi:hypothetical protein